MSNAPYNDVKKSSDDVYQGIGEALAEARSKLAHVETNVDGIRGQLAAGYRGEDGQGYARNIDEWRADFNAILMQCDKLAEAVEGSRHVDFKALTNATNNVQARAGKSVFDGGHSTYSQQAHDSLMGA
ncbi:hypothetical protein ACH4C2_36885 [Streptomyces sp. NPDC018057]|uniref:hypothetical protein n=1 Tax=unclassified Streptomyces TaxID=2593676 RepID=UPI0037B28362